MEDSLRKILQNAGYLSHILKIDESRQDSVVMVKVDIAPGSPASIAGITIRGQVDDMHVLTEMFRFAAGEQYSINALGSGINALLQWHEGKGYPLVSVIVDSMSATVPIEGTPAVELFITVQKGEQFLLEQFLIEGNKETRTEVIEREVGRYRGVPFSPSVAAAIRQRINRLQLFSMVDISEPMIFDDERFGLAINVTETNYNRFDGVLGYVPASQSGEKGYFTGAVDLNFRNLFGTGRRLGVRWFRERIQTEEIEMRYLEPWFFSIPLHLEAGYSSRKQDSTYFRTRYSLNAEYPLNESFSLSFSLESMLIVVPEITTNSGSAKSNTTFYGIGALYDTRNDPVTPISGLFIKTMYQSGPKSISIPLIGTQRVTNQRLTLDAFGYIPWSRRSVTQVGVVGKKTTAGILEPGDLYLAGGTLLLRGYRENEFTGSSVLVGSIEQRFLLSFRSYAYGFVDLGYIGLRGQQETGLKELHLNRTGYGLGIRIESGVGLVGISYALGEGDTFSTGKIHFRLVNEF